MHSQNNSLHENQHSVQTKEALNISKKLKNGKYQYIAKDLPGCRSGVKQPGSLCVFLFLFSGLWQSFSSPELMVASFSAKIWKENLSAL